MKKPIQSDLLELFLTDPSLELANKSDKEGITPLYSAILLEAEEKIFQVLLENGADPHLEMEDGGTCYKEADDYQKEYIDKYAIQKWYKSL